MSWYGYVTIFEDDAVCYQRCCERPNTLNNEKDSIILSCICIDERVLLDQQF